MKHKSGSKNGFYGAKLGFVDIYPRPYLGYPLIGFGIGCILAGLFSRYAPLFTQVRISDCCGQPAYSVWPTQEAGNLAFARSVEFGLPVICVLLAVIFAVLYSKADALFSSSNIRICTLAAILSAIFLLFSAVNLEHHASIPNYGCGDCAISP